MLFVMLLVISRYIYIEPMYIYVTARSLQRYLFIPTHTYIYIYLRQKSQLCAVLLLSSRFKCILIYIYAYMYIYTHIYIPETKVAALRSAASQQPFHMYSYIRTYTHICTYIHIYTYRRQKSQLCVVQLVSSRFFDFEFCHLVLKRLLLHGQL